MKKFVFCVILLTVFLLAFGCDQKTPQNGGSTGLVPNSQSPNVDSAKMGQIYTINLPNEYSSYEIKLVSVKKASPAQSVMYENETHTGLITLYDASKQYLLVNFEITYREKNEAQVTGRWIWPTFQIKGGSDDINGASAQMYFGEEYYKNATFLSLDNGISMSKDRTQNGWIVFQIPSTSAYSIYFNLFGTSIKYPFPQ